MRKFIAIAFAMLAFAPQAFAADLAEPAPAPEVVEPLSTGGWYLRKDISYDIMDSPGIEYMRGNQKASFDDINFDDSGTLGVGVGYQINDYLRVDKTFDYMLTTQLRASTPGGAHDGGPCDGKCFSRPTFEAYSLMANAYVDIYHWGVFTPYVGGGLGTTYIDWSNLKIKQCALQGGNCPDVITHKGQDSWRFTYALMAGTSIDINARWKFDVGYRYRHVDGGPMFARELRGGPGSDKGFDIHEARGGIRYQF